jgi:glutamate dehydrogenase/leucine dehydrogenase
MSEMTMNTDESILPVALANLRKIVPLLEGEIDNDLLTKIAVPKERIELSLTPKLSDGKTHVFRSFVVRHSDALGPAKGGIRMTPTVSLDDVTGLAMEMAWKCALIGVPFGGGKSGILADPKRLSPDDMEILIRSFARGAIHHIGPQTYVPAPDMGTNETHMGYIKDAICYGMGQSTTQGCYVTGKPVILGGIPGRRDATGRGVAVCVSRALEKLSMECDGATATIQGFGNVGSAVARSLHELNICVVGVADLSGAVYDAQGLDIAELSHHVEVTGKVKGFPDGQQMDGRKLLEMPCDVLVPAATDNQITGENAPRISAKIIAEGANSPTSLEADEILSEREVFIIPDILCNAGGVFVSYLEYTQETQQEQMTVEQVETRLQQRMIERFDQVLDLSKQRKLPMREASMYFAVKTVCSALEARGMLP